MKPELQKGLRWHDGVALALPIAVGLFITAGATTATIGTWGTIAVCVVLAVIALLQNHLFAEMASMFPDKAGGGVAVFANEAWKRYFAPPLGAVAPRLLVRLGFGPHDRGPDDGLDHPGPVVR